MADGAGERIDAFFVLHSARADSWRNVENVASRWQAGTADKAQVKAALADIAVIEEFHAVPGPAIMRLLNQRIEADDAKGTATAVRRISEVILAGKDNANTLEGAQNGEDDVAELLPSMFGMGEHRRPSFETLYVTTQPPSRWPALCEEMRKLRRREDEFVYEAVFVGSFEDAFCAAIVNPRIAAVVTADDMPYRSRHDAPVLRSILDPILHYENGEASGIDLARALKTIRPELDLYLLSDRNVEQLAGDPKADCIRRIFYTVEEPLELHLSILEGIAARYETPFFDNLKKYAQRPIGTFHALPIARGKSVFKSEWIRDMGEFYGINLFLAESSATTGGLDSLLEPTGNIKKAQENAARAFGADHVFFVTNGTSTSNKMVVQALMKPGDIAIIDRNCHKSHHYGMVLAGGQPIYVEAFPLTRYSMYGAVPLSAIKSAMLALRAEGRLDRLRILDLTNCTFDGHMYNTRRVMEECLAIKPDLIFLWDEAWSGFAHWSPFLRPRTAMGAAAAIDEWMRQPGRRRRLRGPAEGARQVAVRQGAARDPAGSRPAQGEAAGLPDELDPQVDVRHPPGLDGARARRGFLACGEPVPRSRVHPRFDQPQPAAHRQSRRGAPADGAGGLRPRDERDLDRAEDQGGGEQPPADLEILQGSRRGRDDPGGVPQVRLRRLPEARHELGRYRQGDAGGRVLPRPDAHDHGLRHRRLRRHAVQGHSRQPVQHPAQQDLAQLGAAAVEHQQHAQRHRPPHPGARRDLARDRGPVARRRRRRRGPPSRRG